MKKCLVKGQHILVVSIQMALSAGRNLSGGLEAILKTDLNRVLNEEMIGHTITLTLVLSNSKQEQMLPNCENVIAFPMTK